MSSVDCHLRRGTDGRAGKNGQKMYLVFCFFFYIHAILGSPRVYLEISWAYLDIYTMKNYQQSKA